MVVPYFTPYVRGNEYGLAESLSNMGHDVTIITSRGRAPREKMVTSEYASKSYKFSIQYLPTIVDFGENPVVLGLNIKGYDAMLLQEDYPLICHKAYSLAKKYGIPTMLSSERTYYPQSIAKRAALKVLDKTSNNRLREGVDIITAHCSAAKEFMKRELGASRDIEVIHVGIDTDIFQPRESNTYLKSGKPKILTVARLHEYKGVNYLIQAVKIVSEHLPQAKLYILGKGPEERNLKNQVENLKLEGHIEFLERSIPNEDMPYLYSECDTYVQPSIIEPFGIAVLEAMACGKPVIGTRVGGMLDTIDDGETGLLVPLGNPRELAEAIVKLSGDKTRHRMGENARKRVVENFDWKIIARKYDELLKLF
jgi:glycosyltransferase involved in cell wall biosynthesis